MRNLLIYVSKREQAWGWHERWDESESKDWPVRCLRIDYLMSSIDTVTHCSHIKKYVLA